MKSYLALIAVGLDVVRIAFSKSKIKETAAAVVVGVVGVGLLLAPVSVLSNGFDDDEPDDPPPPAPAPPPNNAPEVSCLWVSNHGSAGFTVEFDVSTPSGGAISFERFLLTGPNTWDVDSAYESGYQGWLDIPGYDGGPPLPYPGYLHSIDFNVAGQYYYLEGSPDGLTFWGTWVSPADVDITLYVVLNSNGALYSMNAWAYDSDGDGYEVPVYYSAGGSSGPFYTLP